jgi:site-specific DNA-methyltransferase (adenine-specific)
MKKPMVLVGNSLQNLKSIPDESVDLIFADPPYWMRVEGTLQRVEGTAFDGCDDEWDNQFDSQSDYKQFTIAWLSQCQRVLSKNGSIWVIGGMQCIYTIGGVMQDLGFWFLNDVIWHKSNPTPNFKGTRLTNSHETLIWATKSEKSKATFHYKTAKELNRENLTEGDWAKGLRKQMGSVWRFPVCQGKERLQNEQGQKLHTTQKPEKLLRRLIAISSSVGDTVLDPFAGTMTTGAAAMQLGRSVIMLEREAEYVRAGTRRIHQTLPLLNGVARAVFDIKPPRVKITDMLTDSYFTKGETLYYKSSSSSPVLGTVQLLESGKVHCKEQTMDMHSAAGLVKNGGNRQNGWNYWYVKRQKKEISIDVIRNQYRKDKFGYVPLDNRKPLSGEPLSYEEFCSLRKQFAGSSFQLVSELLPRLLHHAGLSIVQTEQSNEVTHYMVQKIDASFVHIIDGKHSPDVSVGDCLAQRALWGKQYKEFASILYTSQSQAKSDYSLPAGLNIQTPKELFCDCQADSVWTVFEQWMTDQE